VATAGGGAAEVVPVAVVTSGTVSVRETLVAVTVSEEASEDTSEEATAVEVELVMLVDETMLEDAAEEAVAEEDAAEIELATLAVEAEETMLDKIELAALLVEARLEREETNAELLAWLRLVAVKVVVATGVVTPGVVFCPLPALQEASAMPSAAASLQIALAAQVMVKLMTLVY
jgi:hypothetical protein